MVHLDKGILEEILEWGRPVLGFKRSHAVDGLTCVQGYVDGLDDMRGQFVPGMGAPDRHGFFLFALDLAWSFWLDDCFDAHIASGGALVDVEALIKAGEGEPTTPEGNGYDLLRKELTKRSPSDAERRLWLDSGAHLFRAWRAEELLSSKELPMSYSEYIENGVGSSVVPQILATVSVIYKLDMPSRVGDRHFDRLVRNLSIISRLQNDYYSAEKERREGCRANAVLLLEAFMPPEKASAFVVEERAGYERMLQEDMDAMGADDAFCRLAKVMIASQERLYCTPRERYHQSASG